MKYYYGNQIKEDEIGETCSAHGRREKCIQNFCRKPEGKRRQDKLEWILEESNGKMWTGFIWSRIGTSGRLL
jgi:hypothetical protein